MKLKCVIYVISLWNILETHGASDNGPHIFPISSSVPLESQQLTWNVNVLRSVISALDMRNIMHNEDAVANEMCNEHFQLYASSLTNQLWAVEMFDSSTKIPESVTSDAVLHLGNFDQCLAVTATDNLGQYAFNGQYCGTKISIASNTSYSLSLQMASCIPSTCSAMQLQTMLQTSLDTISTLVGVTFEVEVPVDNCYIEGDKKALDAGSWVVLVILIILALAVVISTVCNIVEFKTGNEKVNMTLKSFSLLPNLKSLLNTAQAKNSVQNMHGLRALSILWVVLGHRYNKYDNSLPLMNKPELLDTYDNLFMQFILNGMPSVDTFFIMSGFLVCYLMMKDLNRGNKFNPVIYYVHRYLRLSTSYALVIAFHATLLGDIGYGPTWRSKVKDQTQICKDTWWSGLLYIDNYVHLDQYASQNRRSVCLGVAWYLTCDMQFAWLAPLVLLPLFYWPKWTTKILGLLIAASCFAPFTSTYINHFYMTDTMLDKNPERRLHFLSGLYTATYMRATPYLIGIALGYFMYKQTEALKLKKWMVALGWICSTAIALAVIFSTAIMYQKDYEYDALGSAFYAGFHRLGWSAVICWIILSCHYGYGGPIDSILSWGGWLPLSRLSYCIYLVHIYVMYFEIINVRTMLNFDHFSVVQRYFGDVVYSVLLATVLHLLIEAPTLGLLHTFLKKSNSKK